MEVQVTTETRSGNVETDITKVVPNTLRVFKGACHACVIGYRKSDGGLTITMLAHDDGHWFVCSGDFSSYWLKEYRRLLKAASRWLRNNALEREDKGGWKLAAGDAYLLLPNPRVSELETLF